MMSNLSPSRERVSEPPLPSSTFQSLDYPLHHSTLSLWQMNHFHLPHRDRDDSGDYDADINASQPYEACAHGSSERPVASNEDFDPQSIDLHQDMSSHLSQSFAACSNSLEFDHMDGYGSLDAPSWMSGPFMSPVSPIAGPWVSSMNKQDKLNEFLNNVGDVLPSTGLPSATTSTQPPQSALVPATDVITPTVLSTFGTPATGQTERGRSGLQILSENDECDEDDQYHNTPYDPNKKTAIPPPTKSRPNDDSNPVYPRLIHEALRKPENHDFEDNCEFCPYYIMEPFQFIQKPWNSCLKARAEFSHTISHAVSDHGFIRGSHPHRHGQRFIAKCALHDIKVKGKNKCNHCSKPGRWTQDDPDDPADETHFGGALCLRCYAEFPTSADLFNHHKELNICTYREDLPLAEKMKYLYITFASSNTVPKFHPPVSKPRENGARKRKLKGGQGQNALSPATKRQNGRLPQGPVRQIRSQPPPSQINSPLVASHLSPPQVTSPAPTLPNTDQNDPMLGYYPTQTQPLYVPQQTEPWFPGVGLQSHELDSLGFSSFIDLSIGPYDTMFAGLSLPYQSTQNAHNWQPNGVQPAGKNQWDQFTDSGFGSLLDESSFNNNNKMSGGHGT